MKANNLKHYLLVFCLAVPSWAQHVLGGNPLYSQEELTVLENLGYKVGYSESLKNPLWVAYKLTTCRNPEKYQRSSQFKTDERTQAKVRPEDYRHSGYSRGHMAPSLAIFLCYGKAAQEETYLMSNIVPQLQKHNAGIWARVEKLNLKKHTKKFGPIFIVTGPIFERDNLTFINNQIAIPKAFYKITVRQKDNGSYEALALLIPHEGAETTNLPLYVKTVRYVENITGLNFFSELPDDIEEELENTLPQEDWELSQDR